VPYIRAEERETEGGVSAALHHALIYLLWGSVHSLWLTNCHAPRCTSIAYSNTEAMLLVGSTAQALANLSEKQTREDTLKTSKVCNFILSQHRDLLEELTFVQVVSKFLAF
jgi:hypothetical protein